MNINEVLKLIASNDPTSINQREQMVKAIMDLVNHAAVNRNGLLDVTRRPQQLSFAQLRAANTLRIPQFKNAKGEPAHSEPDGSDWSPLEWGGAAAGEIGELCNLLKKLRRGDVQLADVRDKIASEIADGVTYLDITAMQCGIDMGLCVAGKFNEVSNRVGSDVHLRVDQSPVDTPAPVAAWVPDTCEKVWVHDRYRFAVPVIAVVVRGPCDEISNHGVEVELITTNNHNYPEGSRIFVSSYQLTQY